MAPDTGVPKMAENPAEMPQTTSFFRSASLSLSRPAIAEVRPAPIWAQGPSLPADPPEAMVIKMCIRDRYQGVCALFVAQAFGIELSIGAQLGILLTATLASIGTAGVPGAGLIMLTLVLTQAGLPVEGVGLLAGIDAVLDMARTSINITGDAAVAVVVAKTEGELRDVTKTA